ncbi:glycosyltransferase [Brevibacterium sp. FAM 24630]|uniref:glycosyltransferase n=1 Tax=Brevibacterium sp. FAM 24630 TaxID=3415680 RepID=UPI003C79DCF8
MRICVLSLHTSPAAQPGQGDAGGMNVYVDQTVRALSAAGHRVDVFTADPGGLDGTGAGDAAGTVGERMELSESITIHHLSVGATTKDELADAIDELAQLLIDHPDFRAAEFVWAHYWISAEAALRTREIAGEVADEIAGGATGGTAGGAPIAVSMHTIGAVKNRDSETSHERPQRLEAEERIAAEADLLVAATPVERRDLITELRAEPDTVVVARPGVDHALYVPGTKSAARERLGFSDDEAIVLYVGRMQFIKGTDVAVDALADLRERDPHLAARTRGILLGAVSGIDTGRTAQISSVHPAMSQPATTNSTTQPATPQPAKPRPAMPQSAAPRPGGASSSYLRGLNSAIASEPSVEVRPPVPSHILVDYYRAADVLIVPSRSESFGLVAAEAAASGLPAIASAVGGLPEIVEHGHSGLLIADHNPHHWATAIETLLRDADLRTELAGHATARAERFDWSRTVAAVLDALPESAGRSSRSELSEAASRRSEALGAC